MNSFKTLLPLFLLPCVASLNAATAETRPSEAEQSSAQSSAEAETHLQEAMSEFEQWRQERRQSRTDPTSGGIDWSNYTRDNGWSTGLSGDSGSFRAVPDLGRGSSIRFESLVMDTPRPNATSGLQSSERTSPVSSLVSEFSEIGRPLGNTGRSLFDDNSAFDAPGSVSRASSSMEDRENRLSRRDSGVNRFQSTPWTSPAATSDAATTGAATTEPNSTTPSQSQRYRPRDLTPSYLRN